MKFGNYYGWYAATAGTGEKVSESDKDADGSICPKGWRLPTAGQIANSDPASFDKEYSFAKMLAAQGYSNLLAEWNASINANDPRADAAPINFVHGGFVVTDSTTDAEGEPKVSGDIVRAAGWFSNYLSSTALGLNSSKVISALNALSTDIDIYSSTSTPVTNGLPVRCVAE